MDTSCFGSTEVDPLPTLLSGYTYSSCDDVVLVHTISALNVPLDTFSAVSDSHIISSSPS